MPTPRASRWATNLTKKEPNFGTAMLDADLTTWLALTAPDFAKLDFSYRDNSEEINGWAGPTEHQIESKAGSVTRKLQGSAEALTAFLAWAFGNVTSSGSADPWSHVIKVPVVCTLNPPSFSFVEGIVCAGSTGTYLLYKGAVVDQITIEVKGKGAVEVTVTVKTDGSETAKTSFAWPTAVASVQKFIGANRTLLFGPLGTEDLTSLLRSFKITVNMGIVEPENTTTSTLVTEYQYGDGRPTIEVEFVLKADKSHAVYGYFTGNTTCILNFTLDAGVTPVRSVKLTMSQVKATAEQKAAGSETQLDVKLMPQWNSTDGGPGQFICKTGQATYLTASS